MGTYPVISVKPYFYINYPLRISSTLTANIRALLHIRYKINETTGGIVNLRYTEDSMAVNRQYGADGNQFTKPLSDLSEDMSLIRDMNERVGSTSQLKVRFTPNFTGWGICTLIGEYKFQTMTKKPSKKKTTTKKKSVKKK